MITHVRIENFRSLKDTGWIQIKPVNILLGANILMGILSNVAILAYVGTDVLDASDMNSFGRQLAATITLLIVDIVYFNKRKHLFVN